MPAALFRGGIPPFARRAYRHSPLATGDDQEQTPTPWVLLVVTDETKLPATVRAWEEAGFGVEIASSVQNALACLAVMTPALIAVDGKLYWPPPPPPGAHRAHFEG